MNKTKKSLVIVAAILAIFLVGMAFGITINQLTNYIAFTNVQENDSVLRTLSVTHQIISATKLKTTLRIHNPSAITVSFNVTVTYYGGETELLSYVVSDSLNAGQAKNYVNTNAVNVTAWHNTGIHVDATH